MTDNPRLREAKRRAAMLRHQAKALPKDSPRRSVMLRLAANVQAYTLLTAMVPIGILLGPMVLPLVWFKSRIDPAVWSPPAGSAVRIVAMVESDWSEPVQLEVPSSVVIDEATPASRTLPPIRKTLEHLLALCRQPRNDQNEPWEFRQIPFSPREWMADDLQAYLESGIPPRGLTWLIHPPPEMSGQFAVQVIAPGYPPIGVDVILGEEYPPAPMCTVGQSGSPIQQLKVVYPEAQVRPVFWQPFAQLAGYDRIRFAERLAGVDLGWLGLYILVYLVALFAIRPVLKVA